MPTEIPSITEREFQAQVIQYAGLAGWMIYHTYDSRRSQPGFPDLVLVRGDTVIFAELKSDKGKTTADQDHWLYSLDQVQSVAVNLWRPKDWSEIEKVLR